MALSASVIGLELALKNCFSVIEAEGLSRGAASPDDLRAKKARLMADAIHTYTRAALVTTNGTGWVTGLCYTAAGVGSVFGTCMVNSTGTLK